MFGIWTPKNVGHHELMCIPTMLCKNNEKNDKFYGKVAFPMYTEMVNFRPQS